MLDGLQAPCVAGVDGCRFGWIVVVLDANNQAQFNVFSSFRELLDALPEIKIFAVDMPIGLPDRVGAGGRGPEANIRPLLGMRQSTVFSIPPRAAVYAEDYWEACRLSQMHSQPAKKVSKQAYNLFPKIRELDALITPDLEHKIFEVHPELALWRLNGEQPVAIPKKIKGQINPEGMQERSKILSRNGIASSFLSSNLPRGCKQDDFLDACANALIAKRLLVGKAQPFPKSYRRNSQGLRMAIWA